MCRGWALGAKEFKKELVGEYSSTCDLAECHGRDAMDAKVISWENMLDGFLKILSKNKRDILLERKSADWKVMIAYYMKKHTNVTNGWLSEHLNMGATQGVSRYVSEFEVDKRYKKKEYKRLTLNITTPFCSSTSSAHTIRTITA
jgi:hypothetical protein